MGTHFYSFSALDPMTNEWGEACAEYEIEPLTGRNTFGPPEFCEPEEGGEVTILKVWLEPDGVEITPSDEELEVLEEKIFQAHDFAEDDYYD